MNPISYYLNKNDSDKCTRHSYQYFYDDLFTHYEPNATLNILESGVEYGGSLSAWKECFPNAKVTGVDIQDVRLEKFKRDDVEFVLGDIKDYVPDREFDLIIEDGSHSNEDAMWAAVNLSNHLKLGGSLVIEDIQEGFLVPFLLWGRLNGDYVLSVIDMRRITNTHDNFLIRIHKLHVTRTKR